MNNCVWLYLDDERPLPVGYDILVPDYTSCINLINLLTEHNIEFVMSFDHDIGDPYFSGYTVAKYIVEHQIPMRSFLIHSANQVGREAIRQLLTNYGYKEEGEKYDR